MKFHLDRTLKLITDTKHKSLYTWAINEVDESGQVVGRDQIPWVWSLYFTATEVVLGEELEIREPYKTDENQGILRPAPGEKPEINHRRFIRAKLRAGDSRQEDHHDRYPTYRMFGTHRILKHFHLQIIPMPAEDDTENCTAWGCVSYTDEHDFRDETCDDCLYFYLKVKSSTFDRYAARISAGTADEIILSVGGVAGFYSNWSPSISTREIKVLARGDEQKLQVPPDLKFEPPRLGSVGEARLYVNAKRTPPEERSATTDDQVADNNYQVPQLLPEAKPEISINRQFREYSKSTQSSMYWIIILLSLIAIMQIIK